MCSFSVSNGGYSCSAVFDVTTGSYTFYCDDIATFAPGPYTFRITAAIGLRVTSVRFTMTLINNCPVVAPQILSDSLANQEYQYVLYNTALTIDYDLASIGNIADDHICGKPEIKFITASGSVSIDAIFNPEYSLNKLLVGYSEDPARAATYQLRFRYYNSINSQNYVVSTESFKVKVIDACNPPLDYTPKMTLTAPVFE